MTKLACWNVRGLNSPLRQKEVRDFTYKNNIGLFGLVEVKINLRNRELFAKRIFRSWELAYNSLPNAVSRIWVAWNPNLFEGSQLHSHEQAITLRMKNKNNLNLGPKPFKFMKGWLRHPRFKPILRDSWEEYKVGNPLVRLAKKLKRLKVPLKALNKEEYGDINKRVEKARQNLENVQKQLMDDPFNGQLQVETQNARETYSNFLTFEEAFFKEKARIK